MGAGADVTAFFGVITLIIGIPSGVQVFNWILTMYKGKVDFSYTYVLVSGVWSALLCLAGWQAFYGIAACRLSGA